MPSPPSNRIQKRASVRTIVWGLLVVGFLFQDTTRQIIGRYSFSTTLTKRLLSATARIEYEPPSPRGSPEIPYYYEVCRNRMPIPVSQQQSRLSVDAEWTIVMSMNEGLVDFFRNWWKHYQELDIHNANLVLMAEDDGAWQKLTDLALPQTLVVRAADYSERSDKKSESLEQEVITSSEGHFYGSEGHRKLITTRPTRILTVLCSPQLHVQKLLYTDVDAVWIQNPFPFLEREQLQQQRQRQQQHVDIMAQIDNPNSRPNGYCSGFIAFFQISNHTALFVQEWEAWLTRAWQHGKITNAGDQPGFRRVLANDPHLQHAGLNISHFPPGNDYFEHMTQEQRDQVVVVHNNWITGYQNKKARFQQNGLWKIS